MTLGKWLKAQRTLKAVSLREMATATGISLSSLNHYELDKCKPQAQQQRALAQYFEVETKVIVNKIKGDELNDY